MKKKREIEKRGIATREKLIVRIEKMVALYSIDRPPLLFYYFSSSFFSLPLFLLFLPLSRDRGRTVYFSRAPIGILAAPNDSTPSTLTSAVALAIMGVRFLIGGAAHAKRSRRQAFATRGVVLSGNRDETDLLNRFFQDRSVSFRSKERAYLLPLLSTDSLFIEEDRGRNETISLFRGIRII